MPLLSFPVLSEVRRSHGLEGELANVLSTRADSSTDPSSDKGSSSLDPRSLGIGIAIGLLAALLILALLFFATSIRRKPLLRVDRTPIVSSVNGLTSSRRHLITNTTQRMSIDELEPYYSFQSSSYHSTLPTSTHTHTLTQPQSQTQTQRSVFDSDVVLDIAPQTRSSSRRPSESADRPKSVPVPAPSSLDIPSMPQPYRSTNSHHHHHLRTAHRGPDGQWTFSDPHHQSTVTLASTENESHSHLMPGAGVDNSLYTRTRSIQTSISTSEASGHFGEQQQQPSSSTSGASSSRRPPSKIFTDFGPGSGPSPVSGSTSTPQRPLSSSVISSPPTTTTLLMTGAGSSSSNPFGKRKSEGSYLYHRKNQSIVNASDESGLSPPPPYAAGILKHVGTDEEDDGQ